MEGKYLRLGWRSLNLIYIITTQQIALTNSSVEVEVVVDHNRPEVLPSNTRRNVVQKSEDILSYITPVSVEGAVMGENVPLITFKLTKLFKTGETIIGISWNHILGMS